MLLGGARKRSGAELVHDDRVAVCAKVHNHGPGTVEVNMEGESLTLDPGPQVYLVSHDLTAGVSAGTAAVLSAEID